MKRVGHSHEMSVPLGCLATQNLQLISILVWDIVHCPKSENFLGSKRIIQNLQYPVKLAKIKMYMVIGKIKILKPE